MSLSNPAPDGKYYCHWKGCSAVFTAGLHLTLHCKEHALPPYMCKWRGCGRSKSLNYRSNLVSHLRLHTGYKPHQCTYPGCNYSASFAWHIKRHYLGHVHDASLIPENYAKIDPTFQHAKRFLRKDYGPPRDRLQQISSSVSVKTEDGSPQLHSPIALPFNPTPTLTLKSFESDLKNNHKVRLTDSHQNSNPFHRKSFILPTPKAFLTKTPIIHFTDIPKSWGPTFSV